MKNVLKLFVPVLLVIAGAGIVWISPKEYEVTGNIIDYVLHSGMNWTGWFGLFLAILGLTIGLIRIVGGWLNINK